MSKRRSTKVGRSIPNARVFQSGKRSRPPVAEEEAGGGTATLVDEEEPLLVPCPHEERTETFIEITDKSAGDELVTVVELLSPSNKLRGDSQKKYQKKQREVYEANVNLAEIDLTRGGHRHFLMAQTQIPESYRTTFQACVYRAHGLGRFELYRIPLTRRLPRIKLPLREQDKDVIIDLQPLVERAFENGAYDDIDYTKPPIPPLEGTDPVWAKQLLKTAGRR